jgi:aminoglycoside phosphotransferase (APT) family kinase protein
MWILAQYFRWLEYDNDVDVWMSFVDITMFLHASGFLSQTFHLVHNDLFARNIMAEIVDLSTVRITGVVNWDMACLAPKFMALVAPLWAWTNGNGHLIRNAEALGPVNDKGVVSLSASNSAASKESQMSTFSAKANLAREMYRLLVGGILNKKRKDNAEDIISRWKVLSPE